MTKCEWLNSKLETYYCDELTGNDLREFQDHLASCTDCRQQLESLNQIDPLVRGVLQHRLTIAQMAARTRTGRPRVFKWALAAATTLAVAGVLLVIGVRSVQESPAPPIAVHPPALQSPIETDGIKKSSAEEQNVNLGKPLDGTPVQPVPQPYLDDALPNGPEFAIADAGQTYTLEAYRGRVLLFAVVSSDQKLAVSTLEQIYEAFGSNGRVRILGVARHRDDDFRGAKFPLFVNNGSKLLGAKAGEFRMLDATGKTKLEGSLADPASAARIKSELGQLGIR